jgi:hypothetical protein
MTSQRFRTLSILGLLALGVVALAGGVQYARVGATAPASPKKQLYRCPMHPQVVKDTEGKCPICGMNLVPATTKSTLPSCDVQEGGLGGCCGGSVAEPEKREGQL